MGKSQKREPNKRSQAAAKTAPSGNAVTAKPLPSAIMAPPPVVSRPAHVVAIQQSLPNTAPSKEPVKQAVSVTAATPAATQVEGSNQPASPVETVAIASKPEATASASPKAEAVETQASSQATSANSAASSSGSSTGTSTSSGSSTSSTKSKANDRVVVVAGLRTPFQKQGTGFRSMTSADLATAVVSEMMQRSGVDPKEVTLCVYGQVVPTLDWLNIAREVVLRAGLPRSIEAYAVSRACATSIQAMTSATEAILAGQHDVAIVGGADSMSDVPLGVSRRLRDALMEAQKGKTPLEKLKAFSKLSARDLVPPIPGFSKEPTTGEAMGEAAEKMAKENQISREWQDEIAHASHTRAAAAWADGRYGEEVMHVIPPPYGTAVTEDNIVRKDSTLDGYSKLKPAFDRKHGTITAGNSSPLTDGASALLVMRESKAQSLGLTPLGYIKSWAYAAVDPNWQLLMGPVFAAPKALDRAGLTLADMDLVDMHEAFAAQIGSNLQALASKKFANEKLGRSEAVGEVDPDKFNVKGGSIALGHPFAATGGRMVISTLRELKRRGKQHALLTLCAAGGLGAAVVLEAAP